MNALYDISTLETANHGQDDPLSLFANWLTEAKNHEMNDPDAMCLATSTKDGRPSARMVLLKDATSEGFKFHTNSNSQKGTELAQNSFAALCFHWKSLRKQVRIEGIVKMVSADEADEYYKTRPHGRQIGGWASDQSKEMISRSDLKKRIADYEKQYQDDAPIPRPPFWNGYRVIPTRIEFWDNGTDRLHTRLMYEKDGDGWRKSLLYP